MDQYDKNILDIIQSEFPICSRPYAKIGKLVGLTEAEVLARVRKLRQKGIIRRIGANFQSRKLGWKSTLCCAKVPEDKLDLFVKTVNKYPGVTHNYLRKHEFNVWFTYIAPSWDDIEKDLKEMEAQTGIEILSLPATKMLKVKVDFKMNPEK
ncbi:siroheme decarboxylase subunit alpha [Desulfothermus sp.]